MQKLNFTWFYFYGDQARSIKKKEVFTEKFKKEIFVWLELLSVQPYKRYGEIYNSVTCGQHE